MKSKLSFKKQRKIAIEALHKTCHGKFAKSCYDQLIKNGCLSEKQIKALKNVKSPSLGNSHYDDWLEDQGLETDYYFSDPDDFF